MQLTIQQNWTKEGHRTNVLRQVLPPGIDSAEDVINCIEAGTLEVKDIVSRLQVRLCVCAYVCTCIHVCVCMCVSV